jgi:hypothetical protein
MPHIFHHYNKNKKILLQCQMYYKYPVLQFYNSRDEVSFTFVSRSCIFATTMMEGFLLSFPGVAFLQHQNVPFVEGFNKTSI